MSSVLRYLVGGVLAILVTALLSHLYTLAAAITANHHFTQQKEIRGSIHSTKMSTNAFRASLTPVTSRVEKTWKFKRMEIQDWKNNRVNLTLPSRAIENSHNGTFCFKRGTKSLADESLRCTCRRDYYGPSCGIPGSVWFNIDEKSRRKLRLRIHPVRLIQFLVVNHEINFLESRIRYHNSTVDLFVVLESRYTALGNKKPSTVFNKLKEGWLSEYQEKIFHIYLDHFPLQGKGDGWYADSYPRIFLGEEGLTRLRNIRENDIIVYCDADEIPNRNVLDFLKNFDGYSEPVKFTYRWTIFGYYWLVLDSNGQEDVTTVTAASTYKVVNKIFKNNIWAMRTEGEFAEPYFTNSRVHKINLRPWTIGSIGHYAGHHCSYCYNVTGIQTKLLSSQADDPPRWADFPEKVEPDYIRDLVESGTFFDDKKRFEMVEVAPEYILQEADKYLELLVPPGDRGDYSIT